MKDQYVGDVNDFFKYAFLRAIQRLLDRPLVVCWMATPDDGGSDGRRRKYLEQPQKYRSADTELFDGLGRLVETGDLSIASIERSGMLRGAAFHSPILQDPRTAREDFFRELWPNAPIGSVVFFDPDNGLEIQSTPKGRKGSSKFLFLDELQAAGQDSRSVIVYQHFGRVQRAPFTEAQLKRMKTVLPDHDLFALTGSHIAFLVASTDAVSRGLRSAAQALRAGWPDLRAIDMSD